MFRSSKHIYAQLIDDLAGVTLATASSVTPDVPRICPTAATSRPLKPSVRNWPTAAKQAGRQIDRGHYKFHGHVEALAEAANAAGLLCCEPKERKKAKLAAEAAAAPVAAKEAAPKEKKEKKEKKSTKNTRRKRNNIAYPIKCHRTYKSHEPYRIRNSLTDQE